MRSKNQVNYLAGIMETLCRASPLTVRHPAQVQQTDTLLGVIATSRTQ